jgi:hypothetical protein
MLLPLYIQAYTTILIIFLDTFILSQAFDLGNGPLVSRRQLTEAVKRENEPYAYVISLSGPSYE